MTLCIRCEAGSRLVSRGDRIGLGDFAEHNLQGEIVKPYEIGSSHCATSFMPFVGHKTRVAGRLGHRRWSGRVKLTPLAWAGMPKKSIRKNSDSPSAIQIIS